jgi:hypothetical protein
VNPDPKVTCSKRVRNEVYCTVLLDVTYISGFAVDMGPRIQRT